MKYDCIIIGAGTAGMTAAVYLARAGKRPLLLESENIGGGICYSPLVENFPGFISISGTEFADKLYTQVERLGVPLEFAQALSVKKMDDGNFTVITDDGEFIGRTVIAATGVKSRPLGLENELKFVGSGISYCALCDGAFYKGKSVAVVGGGDTAVRYATFLSAYCSNVYLIHRRDTMRAESSSVEALAEKPNVKLILSSTVTRLIGDDNLHSVILQCGDSKMPLDIEGLFIAIGHIPCNEAFTGLVALNDQGYIVAGEDCLTSVPGVFAAGDCRIKAVRQLVTAAADGAVAATAACDFMR